MLPNKLAFVDIETTGTTLRDRIIEIGILRVENNTLVDTYQTLINPQMYVSPFIESMTGIHKNDLDTAPEFWEVKDKITELLDDCIFVAHNVRFDYSFIKNELKHMGISFAPKHLCTVKLSRHLFPQYRRHNLDSIIERFHLECVNRHRAFDDAKVLWDFFSLLQKQYTPDILEKAVQVILKKPSLPVNLPLQTIEKLPNTSGVYIFYNDKGTPLYVGKSITIKDRVLSHFANDHNSTKEMSIARQVASIETITTAGELGALFTESMLVKKLQPIYNRKLRNSRKLIVLKRVQHATGYDTVALEEVEKIYPSEIDLILGVFSSKKRAKSLLTVLAKESHLCEKLLGLQSTPKACFAYHLGWCKGACVEKENPAIYNARLTMAFIKTKIKTWPFNGAIMIQEADDSHEMQEAFLVDKWCCIGKVTKAGDYETTHEVTLDVDMYKILVQYLRMPTNKYSINSISPDQIQTFLSSSV